MAESSEERLRKLIAKELSVNEEDVTLDADFTEDLNADSLDLVELMMAVEEEFGVKISDEEGDKIKTLRSALEYLEEHNIE
ncbi:MAG: acyl carrier protein [Chloroflexi bacterium]|nr:acyl carrier protein [Chloroflexota bacterium]